MFRRIWKRVNFRLKFASGAIENEYNVYRRPLFQKLFFLVVCIVFLISIVIYSSFDESFNPAILAAVCVPAIIFFLIVWRVRSFKYVEASVVIVCLLLYGFFLYFNSEMVISNEDFAEGYFGGFVERIIVERLPMFRHKAFFGIVASFCRLAIFRPVDANDFVFRIFLPIVGLILDFNREKKERELFKKFYDSREGLFKFRELFKSHLPESILILKSDFEKILFQNDAFERIFGSFDISSVKIFLKNVKVSKEDLHPLGTNNIIRSRESCMEVPPESAERKSQSEMNELANLNEDVNANKNTLYSLIEELLQSQNWSDDFCSGFIFTYALPRSESTKRIFKVKIFPFIWDGENSVAIVINDITEQYTLINLKVANENKDKVVATVSHELRTPLNGILGMLQILQKEVMQPRLAKYLKICHSSARLLLSLVNSILDLNQIKNNKLKLNPDKFRLKEIMDSIISLFDFQCQQKNLYLRLEMDSALPKFIFTDKDRLAQIIINLIGNALKFTMKGGITLKVYLDSSYPDCIAFSVNDTGVGIKEQEKPKLFQTYGKLEGTERINKHGVGLGLNISNALVKLLNEEDQDAEEVLIKVDTEYDKGSTFSFKIKTNLCNKKDSECAQQEQDKKETKNNDIMSFGREGEEQLPVFNDIDELVEDENVEGRHEIKIASLQQKMMKYISIENEGSPFSSSEYINAQKSFKSVEKENSAALILERSVLVPKKHLTASDLPSQKPFLFQNKDIQVLVADDNPFNLLVARELLEIQGLSVTTALNGTHAVQQVMTKHQNGNPFSLILMDCEMPEMDGYQATEVLVEKMRAKQISQVPIVALTANSVEMVLNKCIQSGMRECLTKPLIEENLKKILEKYILKR